MSFRLSSLKPVLSSNSAARWLQLLLPSPTTTTRGSPAEQQQQQQRTLHLAPPFLVDDYTPAAVTSYRLGRMPAKLAAAQAELADCRACPRDCGVNRCFPSLLGVLQLRHAAGAP